MSETKVCSKCGIEKERSGFEKAKQNKDGFNGKCMPCLTAYRRQYRLKKYGVRTPPQTNFYEDGKLIIESKKHGRFEVLYDAEDEALIKEHRWYIWKPAAGHGSNYYALSDGRGKTTRMHRLVMSAEKGVQIDHRDQNGLNNKKDNLRPCSNLQNQYNRKPDKRNTSGYKGVSWVKRDKKWQAQIVKDGKNTNLGLYETKEEAARVYDAEAKIQHGEFAYLNFPDE
tara:strand:- start:720 stop:1397 length:678 start_codon:yes stop_codon:yes gene_type:complete